MSRQRNPCRRVDAERSLWQMLGFRAPEAIELRVKIPPGGFWVQTDFLCERHETNVNATRFVLIMSEQGKTKPIWWATVH